jgi:hypothetical protein
MRSQQLAEVLLPKHHDMIKERFDADKPTSQDVAQITLWLLGGLVSLQHRPRGSENCGMASTLSEGSAAGGSQPKTERPL